MKLNDLYRHSQAQKRPHNYIRQQQVKGTLCRLTVILLTFSLIIHIRFYRFIHSLIICPCRFKLQYYNYINFPILL